VALGGRALDLLIVLVERAGEIVSNRALLASVWRDTHVGLDPTFVSPGAISASSRLCGWLRPWRAPERRCARRLRDEF
jgi:hypothetical protein